MYGYIIDTENRSCRTFIPILQVFYTCTFVHLLQKIKIKNVIILKFIDIKRKCSSCPRISHDYVLMESDAYTIYTDESGFPIQRESMFDRSIFNTY